MEVTTSLPRHFSYFLDVYDNKIYEELRSSRDIRESEIKFF